MAKSIFIPLLLATLFWSSEAWGKKKKDEEEVPPLPQPLAQKIEVVRGLEKRIVLEAATRSLQPVQFIIRKAPRFGTLSELTPVAGRNDAVSVVYRSAAQGRALHDDFQFAVRLPGQPITAAVPVEIAILEPTPQLVMPPFLDFEETYLGQTKRRRLTIKNRGTAAFRGEVHLPAPWVLEQREVVVPAGEKVSVAIVFTPERAGSFRHEWEWGAGEEERVTLTARARPPFSVSRRSLFLSPVGDSNVRSAHLDLRNNRSRETKIFLQSPEPFEIPFELSLKAGKQERLEIQVPADWPAGAEGELILRKGDYHIAITLRAPPLPAEIVWAGSSSEKLVFSTGMLGEVLEQKVSLTNRGGVEGFVHLEVRRPFSIPSPQRHLRLAPGETREIAIQFEGSRGGRFRQALLGHTDGETLTLPLEAAVELPSEPTRSPSDPDQFRSPSESGKLRLMETVTSEEELRHWRRHGVDTVERSYSKAIPRAEKISLVSQGRRHIAVQWPALRGEAYTYLIERMEPYYDREKRAMLSRWVEHSAMKIETENDGVVAVLKKLTPGVVHRFRIFTVSSRGEFSHPSPSFATATMPPRVWPWGKIVFLLGVVLILWALARSKWGWSVGWIEAARIRLGI